METQPSALNTHEPKPAIGRIENGSVDPLDKTLANTCQHDMNGLRICSQSVQPIHVYLGDLKPELAYGLKNRFVKAII